MKKIIVGILTFTLMCTALVGCGKKQNDVVINKEFSKEKMLTVSGEEIDINKLSETNRITGNTDAGFLVVFPESWNTIGENNIDLMATDSSMYIGYMAEAVVEKMLNFNSENATEEELSSFFEECYSKVFSFGCIIVVNKDNVESGTELENSKSEFEKVDMIAKNGEHTYYFAYNTQIPTEDMSETDTQNVRTMVESVDNLLKNFIIFPVEDSNKGFEGNLTKFSATDMKENEVNESVFADYDLTMVNIWTTWCGFCVEEMPELQELYSQLPENVNLISVCGDAADDKELAQQILDDSKVKFTTLIGNKELEESLLRYVSGYPTTVFIDSKGNVVGAPQVGAPGGKGEIVEGYMSLINDNLKKLGK